MRMRRKWEAPPTGDGHSSKLRQGRSHERLVQDGQRVLPRLDTAELLTDKPVDIPTFGLKARLRAAGLGGESSEEEGEGGVSRASTRKSAASSRRTSLAESEKSLRARRGSVVAVGKGGALVLRAALPPRPAQLPTTSSHSHPWVQGVHEEIMLWPQWRKFRDGVHEIAKSFYDAHAQHPLSQQILFLLLGKEWVAKYCPEERLRPHLLKPPYSDAELVNTERAKLTIALHNYVRPRLATADFAAAHMDYTTSLSELLITTLHTESRNCHLDPSSSPAAVAGHGLASLMTGKAFAAAASSGEQAGVDSLVSFLDPSPARSGLQSRGATRRATAGQLLARAPAPSLPASKKKARGSRGGGLLGPGVDEADYVEPVDAHVLSFVKDTLRGRVTPSTIRPVLWRHRLCSAAVTAHVREVTEEHLVRNDQKDATVSRLDELIRRATRAAYDAQLAHLHSEWVEEKTVQALNVFYTFSGDHSPHLAYLLNPILTTFPELPADHCVLTAMLHTLASSCCAGLSSHRTGGPAAEQVFDIVEALQPELHAFICRRVAIERMGEAYKLLRGRPIPPSQLVIDALAAWDLVGTHLEAAFVGYLRRDATLFIWDQAFLEGWEDVTPLVRAAAVVVSLLKEEIMACESVKQMHHRIISGGRRLFTKDVREAYCKLLGLPAGSGERERGEGKLASGTSFQLHPRGMSKA